ncbi:MAG TPA: hypothetical protein VIN58_11945 [Roseateles sp.]
MINKDDHRERALRKLRSELQKDVGTAVFLSKQCGIWELLRLGYLLHIIRLQTHLEDRRKEMTDADVLSMHLTDDAVKYALSLVVRNGQWQTGAKNVRLKLNNDLTNALREVCQHINLKYEYLPLVAMADVEVSGERDQHAAIDLNSIMHAPEKARIANYSTRLDSHTFEGKNSLRELEPFLAYFQSEYAGVADLFEAEAGISLSDYCEGLRKLFRLLTTKMATAEESCAFHGNGRVDILASKTFYAMAPAAVLSNAELLTAVGSKFLAYMKRQRFRPEDLNNSELRFHHLTRRPYIFGDDFLIAFPEAILDSIFTNAHFSILERLETKPEYIDRRSKEFIDKIVDRSSRHGFSEVGRDVFLNESKKKNLGDIDLVLEHKQSGKKLLIEAKNHALPLDVYFRVFEAVGKHLVRTKEWERKVKRRIEFLERRGGDVSISAPYKYIIVSLHPEILSHDSEILCLSIDEFEQWIESECSDENFEAFYRTRYETVSPSLSIADYKTLFKQGFSLAQFG